MLVEPMTKLTTDDDRSFQNAGPKIWNKFLLIFVHT